MWLKRCFGESINCIFFFIYWRKWYDSCHYFISFKSIVLLYPYYITWQSLLATFINWPTRSLLGWNGSFPALFLSDTIERNTKSQAGKWFFLLLAWSAVQGEGSNDQLWWQSLIGQYNFGYLVLPRLLIEYLRKKIFSIFYGLSS